MFGDPWFNASWTIGSSNIVRFPRGLTPTCERPVLAELGRLRALQARTGPGVGRETLMRYKVNGSADMTDPAMVRAVASPCESKVRDSAATVVSATMRIPFKRS